jgi:amino acid transporter
MGAGLQRSIDWTGAFWVASGVPALVLFSLGAVSATVGRPAWIVWSLSIVIGFLQSFTYAEMAGLFPNKSGGASIYGALGWVRYNKLVAPVSVWCNWFAWSPVLAIGSGLAAAYILAAVFPPDSPITTWQFVLLDLDLLRSGLSLRINATFLLGASILLTTFAIQHGGILRSARATMLMGTLGLLPLVLIALTPLARGGLDAGRFLPLVPNVRDAFGYVSDGKWDLSGWTVVAGGLFVAAWSTYAFETAVCYTREFSNPRKDSFKALLYSGLLCLFVYIMLPLAFQSFLGPGELLRPAVVDAQGRLVSAATYGGMMAPDIYSGAGVAAVLTRMIGGGAMVSHLVLVMLFLTLCHSIMAAMAGSSRTLYQASVDGWLPRYLSRINDHGAPVAAMWTDLAVNLLLLMMSDYVFVLAASNVGYLIFNFLNLNACWIHRIDRPDESRPFRVPNWLLGFGVLLSFVDIALLGFGADVWGPGTLFVGLAFSALIIPVFLYRHYVQDRGAFPPDALTGGRPLPASAPGRAGPLPLLTLACGASLLLVSYCVAAH